MQNGSVCENVARQLQPRQEWLRCGAAHWVISTTMGDHVGTGPSALRLLNPTTHPVTHRFNSPLSCWSWSRSEAEVGATQPRAPIGKGSSLHSPQIKPDQGRSPSSCLTVDPRQQKGWNSGRF